LLSLPKISLLPEHNTRQGFFERPELEALVTALPDYLKDMTRFGYITGMRLGEIKSLRCEDVDREVGALRLRPENAKTGEGRTVMLVGDLADVIERRYQARLFSRVSGTPFVAQLVFLRISVMLNTQIA
jgi:integrase